MSGVCANAQPKPSATLIITNAAEDNLGNYTVRVREGTNVVESLGVSLQLNLTGVGFEPVQATDKFLDAVLSGSLRLGTPGAPPGTATWLAKPAGMSYADLFATFEPLVREQEAALWCRHMTLGPALEFCLHTSRPTGLPAGFAPLALECRAVWPG